MRLQHPASSQQPKFLVGRDLCFINIKSDLLAMKFVSPTWPVVLIRPGEALAAYAIV